MASSPPSVKNVNAPNTLSDFLQNTPPSEQRELADFFKVEHSNTNAERYALKISQLRLYCTSPECAGERFFRFHKGDTTIYERNSPQNLYLTFLCSNCKKQLKIYSLRVTVGSETGTIMKFGEQPTFGPPTPPRLLTLLGDERSVFMKGRRCENQGLGIGAFVYYRRVVESQRDRILSEIIRVSEKLGASADVIAVLNLAKNETQFLKSMALVKDAIPPALLINSHNPLTLLHAALSNGLHDKTDEQCLEIAHDVRLVLAELSERLGQALKDDAELNSAIGRLQRAKT